MHTSNNFIYLTNCVCSTAEKFEGFDKMNFSNSVSFTPPPYAQESPRDFGEESCGSEKIQRGSTSIYIFEGHQECVEGVRNNIGKKQRDTDSDTMFSDQPLPGTDSAGTSQCGKGFKRSVEDEEETVVVIRKRGNKVFVEF